MCLRVQTLRVYSFCTELSLYRHCGSSGKKLVSRVVAIVAEIKAVHEQPQAFVRTLYNM